MSIIKWIKNKYYERKFQEAQSQCATGSIDEAIKILQQILDVHPFAPKVLLGIYHQQIEAGIETDIINRIATIYISHKQIEDDCVAFVIQLGTNGELRISIEYASILFSKGLIRLEQQFIRFSYQYVLQNKQLITLWKLSENQHLLIELSNKLYSKIKEESYKKKDLNDCLRVALLIEPFEPYLTHKEFLETLVDIRLDVFMTNEVTDSAIDILFNDCEIKYNLSNTALNELSNKVLLFAQKLLSEKKYTASLLISQRLINNYTEAKTIYAECAYQLYKKNSPNTFKVKSDLLCDVLGKSGTEFVKAIAKFIPYDSYKKLYINEVCRLLSNYANANKVDSGTTLLKSAWETASDVRYFNASLSSKNIEYSSRIARFIIDNTKISLLNDSEVDAFIKELVKLSDVEFIVNSLESLLTFGKKVNNQYVKQIIRYTKKQNAKRQKIEIINRGLSTIDDKTLIDTKAQYCNDYISSKCYNLDFITSECKSLIGKHADAEVMMAQLAIDTAASVKNIEEKEVAIKKALYYRSHHNKLFDQGKYEQKLPEINQICLSIAMQLHTNHDTEHAIRILYILRDNSLDWFNTYGQLKLSTIESISDTEDALRQLYKIIGEGKNTNAQILDSLWEKIIAIATRGVSCQPIDTQIDIFLKLLTIIDNECFVHNKLILKNKVKNKLYECYSQRGKTSEKAGKYTMAINDYIQIVDSLGNYPDALARLYICKIKADIKLTSTDKLQIDKILKTPDSKAYQKDLAFRWCLCLIKLEQIDSAQVINDRILKSDDQISKLCNEVKKIQQKCNLADLNTQLNKINSNELTAQDAISLGQKLSVSLESVNLVANVSKKVTDEIKEAIRCYAIEKYYNEADFVKSLNGLKVHDSRYLSDPLSLRNIAVMCLRAAETNQLDDSNYKELLSIWATAIYQQKLFIQILDYTSWDDSYTFSLNNALGRLDDNDDLPNNVNYFEESTNGVVSIREVQKALITRMEIALERTSQYQQFYISQIEAIDKFSEQDLNRVCVLVAPHMLLLSSGYRNSVNDALSAEADDHYDNWEEILEIGNLYGLKSGDFASYSIAKQNIETMLTCLNHNDRIEETLTQTLINSIRDFDKLFSTLVSAINTSLNKLILEDAGYEMVTKKFSQICKFIKDDTLSFNFSNYINQNIVEKLNKKSLSLAKGSSVLIGIFDFCKCNPHLKRNLGNIVEALIHNYITDGTSENIAAIELILSSTRDFDQNVVNAQTGSSGAPEEIMMLLFATNEERFNTLKSRIGSKSVKIQSQFNTTTSKLVSAKINIELNKIVEKVNNNLMKKNDALEKMYEIYKRNTSNDRVCTNLVSLISMCIMEYVIADKPGKQQVISVLDSLNCNMSNTFKLHTSEIRQTYDMIYNRLNYQTQLALLEFDRDLNEQGVALKKGLNYLKKLS